MASRATGRVSSSVSWIVSRLAWPWNKSPTMSSNLSRQNLSLLEQPVAPCETSRGFGGFGGIGVGTYFNSTRSLYPSISRHVLTSPRGGFRTQNALEISSLNNSQCTHQARSIMVEVKGNDLEKAIRKWRRKCKEENLRSLKDREYFVKPSQKRVLAAKERDRRNARRLFKMKLNWILSRRQRGF